MTKQEFIRKALLLGFEESFIRRAAEQMPAGDDFGALLSDLSVAIPREEDTREERFCPALEKSVPHEACCKTIKQLNRKGGTAARLCMACSHSEWL